MFAGKAPAFGRKRAFVSVSRVLRSQFQKFKDHLGEHIKAIVTSPVTAETDNESVARRASDGYRGDFLKMNLYLFISEIHMPHDGIDLRTWSLRHVTNRGFGICGYTRGAA